MFKIARMMLQKILKFRKIKQIGDQILNSWEEVQCILFADDEDFVAEDLRSSNCLGFECLISDLTSFGPLLLNVLS